MQCQQPVQRSGRRRWWCQQPPAVAVLHAEQQMARRVIGQELAQFAQSGVVVERRHSSSQVSHPLGQRDRGIDLVVDVNAHARQA